MKRSYHPNADFLVTTIAGSDKQGFQDGNALEAMFANPWGVSISEDGRIYVSDSNNSRIRMIYNDQVTTIAGNGITLCQNGNARDASFVRIAANCISHDGRLYVADYVDQRIRMIYNNKVVTIAGKGQQGFQDGNALNAMFYFPMAICVSNDLRLYVADCYNHRIRMIYSSKVTTVAGNGEEGFKDGNALEAMFSSPCGICVSKDDRVYVSDHGNNRIRMIYNNQVTTIAGSGMLGFQDGNALEAMFNNPRGICVSNDGLLYVCDYNNHRIRMIYDDQVTTIAGNGEIGFQDGDAQNAMFRNPCEICTSNDGTLYVADNNNHRIRMITCTYLQKSPFGFALLLDVRDNILCDSQMSFNDITYHLHSTLVNFRCPFLFDNAYYSLILQSNISNKSFESFLTFLYSNKLTKEHNEIWPANMTIKNIVELIFVFDVMMNCKWIIEELNRRFRKQLIEILNKNEQECVKELIVDVLPYVYKLQEIAKTKPAMSTTATIVRTNTEHCYNVLIDKLQKKKSIVKRHLAAFKKAKIPVESFRIIIEDLMSEPTGMLTLDDETMVLFGAELTELSKLAFAKTNIGNIDKKNHNTETQLQSSISTQHLDKWTTPDFVIKLPNDDISYHVHKLILCGRWKYFCQMIESGLKEANDDEMTLSDDWNKSRFEKMMKYIYLNEIDKFDEIEDVEWLNENANLYGIPFDKKTENGLI